MSEWAPRGRPRHHRREGRRAAAPTAPSATIHGRSLLIDTSSLARRRSAIDKTYTTVEHGRMGPRAAALDGIGENVANPTQFCRVLQEFHGFVRGGKRGLMCYCSVNQLLEPRPGGD